MSSLNCKWGHMTKPDYSYTVQYLPAIENLARTVWATAAATVALEDLISVGTLASLQNEHKYAPELDTDYWSFAKHRVKGSLLDYIREGAPINPNTNRTIKQVVSYAEAFMLEHGYSPTIEEISEGIGISEKRVNSALSLKDAHQSVSFIDEDGDEHEEHNMEDVFGRFTANLYEFVEYQQLVDLAIAEVKELPDNLRVPIEMFFLEEATLMEIQRTVPISIPGLNMSIKRGLNAVRITMGDKYGIYTFKELEL